MKKHFFLALIGLFAFTSCSSDDDANNNGPDPVLGTWAIVAVDSPFFDPAACPDESTVTFHEDNLASSTVYVENNDCVPESDEGEWENLGSGSYKIVVPVVGAETGDVTFSGSDRFIFASTTFGNITFEKR